MHVCKTIIVLMPIKYAQKIYVSEAGREVNYTLIYSCQSSDTKNNLPYKLRKGCEDDYKRHRDGIKYQLSFQA